MKVSDGTVKKAVAGRFYFWMGGGGDSTTLINMDDISIYIYYIDIFHIYMYISRSLYTLMVIHYEQTRTSF